jgi:hypothetical protein
MRTQRMRELIEQRTQQLKDHETGHRRLSDAVRKLHGLVEINAQKVTHLDAYFVFASFFLALILSSGP